MLLDIALGILIAIATAMGFDLPITANWVFLGIAFALLPDTDIVFELLKRGTVGGDRLGFHREWFHAPILYLGITALLVFWSAPIATLFGLCTLWHLLHDSTGIGWGIKWLWPWNRGNYKLFCDRENKPCYQSPYYTYWSVGELNAAVAKHGNPNWFRDTYLRFSWTNLAEALGLVLGLAALWWYLG